MDKSKNKGSDKASKKPKQNQGNATAKKSEERWKEKMIHEVLCQENGILLLGNRGIL